MDVIRRVQQRHQQLVSEEQQQQHGINVKATGGRADGAHTRIGTANDEDRSSTYPPPTAVPPIVPRQLFVALLNVAHQRNVITAAARDGADAPASSATQAIQLAAAAAPPPRYMYISI
jgi:hypothetical protein